MHPKNYKKLMYKSYPDNVITLDFGIRKGTLPIYVNFPFPRSHEEGCITLFKCG